MTMLQPLAVQVALKLCLHRKLTQNLSFSNAGPCAYTPSIAYNWQHVQKIFITLPK